MESRNQKTYIWSKGSYGFVQLARRNRIAYRSIHLFNGFPGLWTLSRLMADIMSFDVYAVVVLTRKDISCPVLGT